MDALDTAIADVFDLLPEALCRSLTDQEREIAGPAKLAEAAGFEVYLCNPHSPW